MTRRTVTYGRDRGRLERIYDRLRKRSARHSCDMFDGCHGWVGTHAAYVAGVRDALNEVKRGDPWRD